VQYVIPVYAMVIPFDLSCEVCGKWYIMCNNKKLMLHLAHTLRIVIVVNIHSPSHWSLKSSKDNVASLLAMQSHVNDMQNVGIK